MPKDAAERSRATMWDVIRFAEYHAYDAIIVENVVEVTQWVLYGAWLAALQQLGYRFREVYLNSMHTETPGMAGAPQSRDRVYIVAWRKGIKAPNVDPRPPDHADERRLTPLVSLRRTSRAHRRAAAVQQNSHCVAPAPGRPPGPATALRRR